jgi:cyclopropane fatty-acyl-phospholipid synthase-like methyltransferase
LHVPAVPDGEFVQADLTELELESESFDAVVSFYAFNHVHRKLLAPTFARIRGWLVPSGLLMRALGTSDTEGWTGDWLGARTYSGFGEPARKTQRFAAGKPATRCPALRSPTARLRQCDLRTIGSARR